MLARGDPGTLQLSIPRVGGLVIGEEQQQDEETGRREPERGISIVGEAAETTYYVEGRANSEIGES